MLASKNLRVLNHQARNELLNFLTCRRVLDQRSAAHLHDRIQEAQVPGGQLPFRLTRKAGEDRAAQCSHATDLGDRDEFGVDQLFNLRGP